MHERNYLFSQLFVDLSSYPSATCRFIHLLVCLPPIHSSISLSIHVCLCTGEKTILLAVTRLGWGTHEAQHKVASHHACDNPKACVRCGEDSGSTAVELFRTGTAPCWKASWADLRMRLQRPSFSRIPKKLITREMHACWALTVSAVVSFDSVSCHFLGWGAQWGSIIPPHFFPAARLGSMDKPVGTSRRCFVRFSWTSVCDLCSGCGQPYHNWTVNRTRFELDPLANPFVLRILRG